MPSYIPKRILGVGAVTSDQPAVTGLHVLPGRVSVRYCDHDYMEPVRVNIIFFPKLGKMAGNTVTEACL